jgi:hypothetical protein
MNAAEMQDPLKNDDYFAKWIKLGWNGAGKPFAGFVDPERLVVETTNVGRYEGRLFKAMLTWLRDYGDLLNVQRLLHYTELADLPVLGAAVDIAIQRGGAEQRLRTILKHCHPYKTPQILFKTNEEFGIYEEGQKEFGLSDYLKWGLYCTMAEFYNDSMFDRNYVLGKNPLLAYRAFFGVTIRAEIFSVLDNKVRIHIRGLAEKLGYAYSAVYNEVMHMVKNGFLVLEDYGRAKVVVMSDSFEKYLQKMPVFQLF